jgi:hypothetical protein
MKPKAWSHSALDKFKNCPRAYYELSVAKNFVDEFGPEAAWGDRVHKAIEAFIKHETPMEPTLTAPMAQRVKDILETIPEDYHIHAENKIALDRKLKRCSWFAKDTWVRGIMDVIAYNFTKRTAIVKDWKTGKVRPSDRQLKLFALLVFCMHKDIDTVHTSYEWLAYNDVTENTYYRTEMQELWGEFLPDLKVFKDFANRDHWPAKPSGLCKKYCAVLSCPNNGKYSGGK